MRATLNLPPSVRLIEAALEGLVQVNRVLIETGVVPPSPLDTRVRYRKERSGLEEWDNAKTCLERGWGDCEDLNAWECARINLDEDPEAICTLIRTGTRMFHCVVLLSDGSHHDVCPDLGMRVPGTALEGIPWIETRARNYVGARGFTKLPPAIRKLAPRVPYRPAPKPSAPTPSSSTRAPYRPASSRSEQPEDRVPYRPGSTRPTETGPTTGPTAPTTGPTATEMVSPTSVQNPQQDMMPQPMQEYAADEYDEAESLDLLDDEGEEFDEEMVDE